MPPGEKVSESAPSVFSCALELDALDALKLCINRVREITEQIVVLESRILDSNQVLDFERRLSAKIEKRLTQFKAELTALTDPCGSAPHDGNDVNGIKQSELQVLDGPEREVDVVSPLGNVAMGASAVGVRSAPHDDDVHGTRLQIPDGSELEVDVVSPPQTTIAATEVSVDEATTCENLSFEDVTFAERAPWDTSIWNMGFFLGHRTVGKCGTVHIFILLVLNVITQGVFLLVTSTILTEKQFTDTSLQNYRDWRQNIGQNVKYYDKLTFTSLAERVCSNGALEMSGGTREELKAMEKYLPKDNPSFFELFRSGPSLHTVALACWSLTILHEVTKIIRELTALAGVRIRRSTNISIEQEHQAKYILKSVSCGRLIGYIFITLIRAFICILLWYQGTLFLTRYTIDPADLILNAVALEVVLSVDQGFYVLAPSRAKCLLENMNPLKCPAVRPIKRCQCGLDLTSVGLTIIFLLFISGCIVFEIIPLVTNITKAKELICGGNKLFVYAVDPMYFVYSSPTQSEGATYKQTLRYPHVQAIQELIHNNTRVMDLPSGVSKPVPLSKEMMGRGVDVVIERAILTMDQAVEALSAGKACDSDPLDRDLTMQRYMSEVMRIVLDGWKNDFMTCEDALSIGACHHHSIFRAVCPFSCGCDLPFGPGLRNPLDGCPTACMSTKRGVDAIVNAPCSEKSPAELRLDILWVRWTFSIGNKIEVSMGQTHFDQRTLLCASGGGNCTETLIVHGCGAIPLLSEAMYQMVGDPGDLCRTGELNRHAGLVFRPLATMCPVTCDCIGKTDEDILSLVDRYCPGTCAV